MTARLWSEEEDAMLRAHYVARGPSWIGWEDLLPDRTRQSIRARAKRLHLCGGSGDQRHYRKRTKETKRPTEYRVESTPDPYEPVVMKLMEHGMVPTEIDKLMHWQRGTSSLIMSERWRRDKEHGKADGTE